MVSRQKGNRSFIGLNHGFISFKMTFTVTLRVKIKFISKYEMFLAAKTTHQENQIPFLIFPKNSDTKTTKLVFASKPEDLNTKFLTS